MGNILLPIIMNSFTISTTSISFSPIIFIGATIFSLITVFISCRKPGKIASNVSPIEATKYIDVNSYTRKKKKSSKGKKIYNMAIYNILRNKKKSFVLILSMSLSLILFNSVFTFTKGFNMDKYLSHFIIADFIAGSANYFNDNQFRSINDTPSEQMINSIDALNGIENSGRIYYSIEEINSDVDNESRVQLYGLEDFPLSLLNIYEGEVDLEKLKSGNYIIEGVNSDDNGKIIYESSKYSIGDKVRITFENNNTNEYEVIVKAELKHNMSARYYLGDSSTMYLTSNKFIDEIKNPLTMCYLLNVEDQYINKTESFLYNYTNNINPQMDYESKEKLVDDFKSFQNMFLLVGSVLSFIIGIIGILNFINSILTSIISRRREFAMLQSIGMTKKQLNKMILLEGLFYAIITISISIVLGSIISYTVVSSIAGNIWFFKYKFIIHPILITSPILIIISILVPFIANLKMNNQTIVERLREVE
jgi:putative ABC transport system permease protein